MRVVILGRHQTLYDTACRLLDAGRHEVVGIITARAAGDYTRTEADFEALARQHHLPFLCTQTLASQAAQVLLQQLNADVAVSVNWVSVIDQATFGYFKHGIINAHLGDLPRYRGNAVPNWALLNHEEKVTLTLHWMDPGELDSGDILAKADLPLTIDTTIADINQWAQAVLPAMMTQVVDQLADGSLQPVPQSKLPLKPFRCHPRLPQDGRIDWSQSARHIHALVRSLVKPYPGAYTYYRDKHDTPHQLFVWQSRLVCEQTSDVGVPGHIVYNDKDSGESHILTGQGIIALQAVSHGADGEVFKPGHVWRSTRARLGLDVQAELFRLIEAQQLSPSQARELAR
ncbi:MAG: hypothetical protein KC476_07940 [Cyanobacteria bacterium HKST-UBA06]|nr:hypothetical protein [Cyanobacteria bacterium HKST-UBA06]